MCWVSNKQTNWSTGNQESGEQLLHNIPFPTPYLTQICLFCHTIHESNELNNPGIVLNQQARVTALKVASVI